MKKGQMYLWNCINKNLKEFDDKAFGEDLLSDDYHLELEDGKIVYLSY